MEVFGGSGFGVRCSVCGGHFAPARHSWSVSDIVKTA